MSAIFARLMHKPLVLEVEMSQENGKRICLGAYHNQIAAEDMVNALCEEAGAFEGGNFILTKYSLNEEDGDEPLQQWVMYDEWTVVEPAMSDGPVLETPHYTCEELADLVNKVSKDFVQVSYSQYSSGNSDWRVSTMFPWEQNVRHDPNNHCIGFTAETQKELLEKFNSYCDKHAEQIAQL